MERRTRVVIWAVCLVTGLLIAGLHWLAIMICVLLGVTVEIMMYFYNRSREIEAMASRRQCMFFVEQYTPGVPVDLGPRFADRVVSGPASELQKMRDRWVAQHAAAGNACINRPKVDDGKGNMVPCPMELPAVIEYARYGHRVMEDEEQYLEYLRTRIIDVETAYHVALASRPENYVEDYVLNPHYAR